MNTATANALQDKPVSLTPESLQVVMDSLPLRQTDVPDLHIQTSEFMPEFWDDGKPFLIAGSIVNGSLFCHPKTLQRLLDAGIPVKG